MRLRELQNFNGLLLVEKDNGRSGERKGGRDREIRRAEKITREH